LRVLIVSREYPPSSEGGISTHLTKIVPRLLDRGVDLGVLCYGGGSLAGEKIYSMKVSSKILYNRGDAPTANDLASILNDIRRLDTAASEISLSNAYDLIHVQEPIFGPFISSPLPMLVTVHATQIGEVLALRRILNSSTQVKRLVFSAAIGILFDEMCCRKSRKIIAVSPHLRNELIGYYRLPAQKIDVIPNGIDRPTVVQVNRDDSYDKKRIVFTYVGRLVDRKRVDVFLRALSVLKRKGFNEFTAYIVGSGPSESFLKSLSGSLGLQQNVEFTGYVDDSSLSLIFAKSDVLVLPSVYESWGFTIYEAAAYGCAPVVSDLPFFSEYLKNENNALLFKPSNVADLAKKMIMLYSDRGLLLKIREEAKKLAGNFNWEDTVTKTMDLYRSLCADSFKLKSR
jgi:glycosyltransferase involved in cell wall biosynthesis